MIDDASNVFSRSSTRCRHDRPIDFSTVTVGSNEMKCKEKGGKGREEKDKFFIKNKPKSVLKDDQTMDEQ